MRLLTGRGATIDLGRELGKGGEGAVYELPATPRAVAKLYHESLTPRKQDKLRLMARAVTRDLLNYTSWPVDTLHRTARGPVVGFLMPRVTDRLPIHEVYGPSHRRTHFPGAGWDFLVHVARNTAAAFAMIHQHGHVLGDVNQGNVLVGRDGRVVLIDSDSFQFSTSGGLYLCEVGVAHFTPPELQTVGGFATVRRTPQHDAFGLALLVFHLLFGGRHPYSGVPLNDHVGNALEADIRALRFAYARDGRLRGTSPPPRSVPFGIVPQPIQRMFHAAFTEAGVRGGRPDAATWVKALDALARTIRQCPAQSIHRYPHYLGPCPWCMLERQGVALFLQPISAQPIVVYNLRGVWARIEAVAVPACPAVPQVDTRGLVPSPLPPAAVADASLKGFVSVLMSGFHSGVELSRERNRREHSLATATGTLESLVRELPGRCGVEAFQRKKDELARCRAEYLAIDAETAKEIQRIRDGAVRDQKRRFLESLSVATAQIPGVGATKKSVLRTAGICSAADVAFDRLLRLKGFGPSSARAMVGWRAACEQRFQANPTLLPQADIAAVHARYAQRRRTLEAFLDAGPAALASLAADARAKTTAMVARVQQAVAAVAQAQVDMKVV
ncbi:MAG: helix-hairpin-helix domain-containing protein [Planctomycetes bacterium]|nr:helix-hairpin-helix domain-containing protein [Planctomycetota bacterium]